MLYESAFCQNANIVLQLIFLLMRLVFDQDTHLVLLLVVVGWGDLFKSLRFLRFKSDKDEILQDCSCLLVVA